MMKKQDGRQTDQVKITIVYDNESIKTGCKAGWGFAALIECKGSVPILFDTGADGSTLLNNMQYLGIDAARIGKIVISHDHSDHTGGLNRILEINKEAELFLPASLHETFPERRVTFIRDGCRIAGGIFSTGELKGMEQSLAIETDKGILMLTGCSHPGIGEIIEAGLKLGHIYGIAGGFHGFRDFGRLGGLSLIVPCHCTRYKSEILKLFPQQSVRCGVGLVIEQ
ncbi:MAG: MBL fold metallo-hydrolase [Dehalococcoidales bacterium]|nr:MBL fold metallo-hydrolase [Dehalococcoidales bacterium]